MAWVDAMRLRRKADIVRAIGWVNLIACVLWALLHLSEGLALLAVLGVWTVAVMAVTHGVAWIIDRRAEHVVRR